MQRTTKRTAAEQAAFEAGQRAARRGACASAFDHTEWGPTIGFYTIGRSGRADAYTTMPTLAECEAYADGFNKQVAAWEKPVPSLAERRAARAALLNKKGR